MALEKLPVMTEQALTDLIESDEHAFVELNIREVLPYLEALKAVAEQGASNLSEQHQDVIRRWLGKVGHVHTAARVYDTEGNLLFKLPPYMRRLPSRNSANINATYHAILKEGEVRRDINPIYGLNATVSALEAKYRPTEVYEQDIEDWNSFLRFCELPLLGESDGNASSENNINKDISDLYSGGMEEV